jgi:pimeloyl-ACP methyl ester carboxylesterase
VLLDRRTTDHGHDGLHVFARVVREAATPPDARWTTLLPGFPDGSYGLAQIDALLGPGATPRLFVERDAALYSRAYRVSTGELRNLYSAITRRNGAAFMSRGAGFVDEHRRHSERWDLQRLYLALRDTVAFHLAGSVEDPFEPRQIVAARERLGEYGVDVRLFPGGHMTTSEHPELLADAIRVLARAERTRCRGERSP